MIGGEGLWSTTPCLAHATFWVSLLNSNITLLLMIDQWPLQCCIMHVLPVTTVVDKNVKSLFHCSVVKETRRENEREKETETEKGKNNTRGW